jgi:hypothetical protein
MNELNSTPVMPSSSQPSGPAGWFSIWIKAVTKPNEQTFIEISESPDAKAKTAYIWAFIAGTISGVIQAFVMAINATAGAGAALQRIPGLEQYLSQAGSGGHPVVRLIGGICMAPVAGLLSIAFLALWVAIVQWVAKLFGGTGMYEKLLYAFAAISVPVSIVSSLLGLFGAIPYVGACFGILSIGVSLYAFALEVIASKAVNRFGLGQAIGSVLVPFAVIFIFCICVIVIGAAAVGAVIGRAFENYNY